MKILDGLYHWAMVMLALLALLRLGSGCRNAEQQKEINWLDNVLYDLEHPTTENSAIRRVWCREADSKADTWRTIPGWDTNRKVKRYLKACAQEQR